MLLERHFAKYLPGSAVTLELVCTDGFIFETDDGRIEKAKDTTSRTRGLIYCKMAAKRGEPIRRQVVKGLAPIHRESHFGAGEPIEARVRVEPPSGQHLALRRAFTAPVVQYYVPWLNGIVVY